MLEMGSLKKTLVSIVIPAYKQEKTIKQDIENIYNVMSQTRWDFELVVIVDGLVDNTYEEAKKFVKPNVKVYGYEKNMGKGFAVRYGMGKTRGELIAFIDSGMDINPNGISMVLEHMEWYDADVIVGSKRHPVSKIKYPFIRKLYSFAYHAYVWLLFGIRLKDTQTGLKVFKRNVIATVLPRLLVKRFAFDIEILTVCDYLGFKKIYEAPIEINWDIHNTNFSPFLILDRNVRRMLMDTLAVFYRMHVMHYYRDSNKPKWEKTEELKPIEPDSNKNNYRFSVVIAVREINDFLKETIQHLKRLEYPDFEVIVVTDSTSEYETGDNRFKFIPAGNISPGGKRNLGFKNSSGEIVVFLDDDAYPSPEWLNRARTVFNREDTYAVCGPALTPPCVGAREAVSGRVLESYLCSGPYFYRHRYFSRLVVHDYPTVNLFIKREAFLSVGGFTTEFWPGEDTKLCLDLVKKYQKGFIYDPNVVVYHHRRELLTPFLEQISRYGLHRGQFARIFPETSRLPGYFIPSLFTLGLFTGPFVVSLLPFLQPVLFITITTYLALLSLESTRVGFVERSFTAVALFAIGAFETHLVYGISFLVGFIRKPRLKLREINARTGNYLGG
jgi:glycosyltransferase involved in cell wall biosynthesis